ncbi:MAG: hypothetical protein M1818_006065 [Claussenomyces sp. TS43310]|nr:MAG: hypothetical protein M1818_006065 [Claussenomyces sp. TS43310]
MARLNPVQQSEAQQSWKSLDPSDVSPPALGRKGGDDHGKLTVNEISSSDDDEDIPAKRSAQDAMRARAPKDRGTTPDEEDFLDQSRVISRTKNSALTVDCPEPQDTEEVVHALNASLNESRCTSTGTLHKEKPRQGITWSLSETITGVCPGPQTPSKPIDESNISKKRVVTSAAPPPSQIDDRLVSPATELVKNDGRRNAAPSRKLLRPKAIHTDLSTMPRRSPRSKPTADPQNRARGKPDPYDQIDDVAGSSLVQQRGTMSSAEQKASVAPRSVKSSQSARITRSMQNARSGFALGNGREESHNVVTKRRGRPPKTGKGRNNEVPRSSFEIRSQVESNSVDSAPPQGQRKRVESSEPVQSLLGVHNSQEADGNELGEHVGQRGDEQLESPADNDDSDYQTEGSSDDVELVEENGVSSILLDLSPVEPAGYQILTRSPPRAGESRAHALRTKSRSEELLSVEDSLGDTATGARSRRKKDLPKILQLLEDDMEHMRTLMDSVGCDEDGIRTSGMIICTENGRNFSSTSARLLAAYKQMTQLKSVVPIDADALQDEQAKIEKSLRRLSRIVDTILNEHLSDKVDGDQKSYAEARGSILRDLDLHMIPGFVQLIDAGIESYKFNDLISTAALEEILELAEQLFKLMKAARAEPEDVQSRASYEISRPTVLLVPRVRDDFRKHCMDELAARKAAIRAAKPKAKTSERARKRKERVDAERRAEEQEYERRLREREVAITASLNFSRAQLGLPLCGSPTTAKKAPRRFAHEITQSKSRQQEIAEQEEILLKAERRLRELRRLEESEARASQLSHDNTELSDSDDIFADRTEGDRLHMFGGNNTNRAPKQKPWTRAEMEILVDGLKENSGLDRYEIISTKLDRSLEEIFEWCKNFKITMEDEHMQRLQQFPGRRLPPLESYITSIRIE